MDKYIFDKKNGLWYELQGDYYIPSETGLYLFQQCILSFYDLVFLYFP